MVLSGVAVRPLLRAGACAHNALAADERDGVWGGLTRAERLQVVRADVA